MKRFLSLILTLTMLTTLFVGFSAPVMAENEDVTISIVPDVTEIAGANETKVIKYTITITPTDGKPVGSIGFSLKPSDGMTLSDIKLKATEAPSVSGKEGYWINSSELKFDEEEETGIYANFSYTPSSKRFVAYGTTPERTLTTGAVLMEITATVDASVAKTYTLGAENPSIAQDGSSTPYTVNVATKDVVAEGIHVCANLTNVPAKAATCTEAGNIEYWSCPTCNKKYADAAGTTLATDVVIPAAHKFGELVPAKAETCTEAGNVAYYECSVCNKKFAEDKTTEIENVVIPAAHKLTLKEAKDATCKEEGNIKHYNCSICKKNFADENGKEEITESVIIDILPHTEAEIAEVPATCTKNGLTAGKKCSVCNTIITPQKLVKKLAHNLVKTEAVDSTCVKSGHAEYWTCETCEKMFADEAATEEILSVKDVELPLAAHVMGDWVVSEDGNSKTRACTVEGCDYTETAIIDAECAHEDTFYEFKQEPTCTETGIADVICGACYEVVEENVEVEANGHAGELEFEVPATCTTAGHKAYWVCYDCGKIFSDQYETEIEKPEIIPALGHDWSGEAVDGIKTCGRCDATQKVNVFDDAKVVANNLNEAVITEEDKELAELGYTVTPSMDVAEVTPDQALKDKFETFLNKALDTVAKFIVNIEVKKEISHTSNGSYVEPVTESNAPIEVEVAIPAAITGKAIYRVIRVHNGNVDEITATPNDDGEYIVVAGNTIKMFTKKFSEYAIVGEDAAPTPPVNTGGGASTYTVKFNTNGGSVIKSVSVNKNDVVAEPTAPTKKGYTFDGWYTDRQLTTPYDFTSKVTKNFTLFAKWVEDNKEPGTDEPGTEEPGTDEPTTVSFDDIKATDWFYDSVKFVVDNKLMNGVSDTEFAPNNTLTRAMLVTVLYRNAGEPEVTKDASFADVDADAWYAKAVVWAEANGIVNGVSDTEFAPNANITREQIATIMYRYAKYNGDDVTAVADIEAYADATNVSDYAVDAMKYAVGSGLINGKTETTLNPQDNATRAEIATILKRFIEANAVVENPAEGTTEETTEEAVEETVEETTEETAE